MGEKGHRWIGHQTLIEIGDTVNSVFNGKVLEIRNFYITGHMIKLTVTLSKERRKEKFQLLKIPFNDNFKFL